MPSTCPTPPSPSAEPCWRDDDPRVLRLQEDLRTPVWVATLSDGRTAFMDDDAGGTAWPRLADYCRGRRLSVVALELRFRSHRVRCAPDGAYAYFFRRQAVLYGDQSVAHYYLAGHQESPDGPVLVGRWMVPELILVERQARPASLCVPGLLTSYFNEL